jgi:hypothetical protein
MKLNQNSNEQKDWLCIFFISGIKFIKSHNFLDIQ